MDITEIKKLISKTDACMMTTISIDGKINSRPMLCNHQIDGLKNLFFFCMKDSIKVSDLQNNNKISLIFSDSTNGLYANIQGIATITDNKSEMAQHWDKKLDVWWKDQENTPNICMIHCHNETIRYWHQGKDNTINI